METSMLILCVFLLSCLLHVPSISFILWHEIQGIIIRLLSDQRTNGPVNAHLISWPSKAQNKQNLEKIYGKEMTLTFNTHIPS